MDVINDRFLKEKTKRSVMVSRRSSLNSRCLDGRTFGPSPAAVPSLAVLEDDRPVLRTPLLSLHLTAGKRTLVFDWFFAKEKTERSKVE